jgi:peptidoglycan/LPS O-acetylase OafA/YrhL
MWVLLYHVDVTLQKAKYFELEPLSSFTSVGYRGVELFFLLSGFVMARTFASPGDRPWRAALGFGVRRALRIFPAYLVLFIPLFFLAAWTGLGAPRSVPVDAKLFVLDLLLLPREDLTTYIPVAAWTLTHELMFYGLFMVAFVSWRWFIGLMTAWAAIGLACSTLNLQTGGWSTATSALNTYFLLGILCSGLPRIARPTWRIGELLLAGACLIFAVQAEANALGTFDPAVGAAQAAYATAFFLLIHVCSGNDFRLPRPLESIGTYLGRTSYGIYLISYPAIVVIARTCKFFEVPDEHAAVFVLVGSVASTIVLAEILHRYVELPAMALGKRLLRKAA